MTFTIAPMKMTMTTTRSYHLLRIAAESAPEKSNAGPVDN
jgi:hypothetical protein